MKNRQLDATLQSSGLGVASLRDLANSVEINVVEIPSDVIEKIGAPYQVNTIPANTYTGQDKDVVTASVINYLIVRPDMDEELVYQMTKGLFENLDQLAAAHASAKAIKLDKNTIVSPVPVHPGAMRYFKEKRGSNRSPADRRGLPPRPMLRCPDDTSGHPSVPPMHNLVKVPHGAERKTAAETAIESAEHIPGWGSGAGARILFAIAVAFSVFQLWTSAYSPLPSQVVRSVHVGFLLLLLFGLYANAATDAARRTVFWLAAVVAFALSLYHWIFYEDLLIRAGEPSHTDIVIGVLAVGLVFWAGKKMMGWTLPLICLIFLAYGLFGQYLPHPFNHRGYDFEQVVEVLFLGTEGIYGTPIYVSSSYIFLFILFGAFLERAGMIQLFNDIAMGTVGASRAALPRFR